MITPPPLAFPHSPSPPPNSEYFPAIQYKVFSFLDGLRSIGVCTSFAYIRKILKNKMHSKWSKNQLSEDGILNKNRSISCEIDESEILGKRNVIYWMFGIVERKT